MSESPILFSTVTKTKTGHIMHALLTGTHNLSIQEVGALI
jgi:hypothetical protein